MKRQEQEREEERAAKAKAAPAEKPAMSQAEVQKPLKQRAVINRAEKVRAEPPPVPQYGADFDRPKDLWSELMAQRALQSRMRAEAAASPYAQMFAQQRSARIG